MNETPFVPVSINLFDISMTCSSETVVLSGLDQTEVMRFLTLMPKMSVQRYYRDALMPKLNITLHQENKDGNDK